MEKEQNGQLSEEQNRAESSEYSNPQEKRYYEETHCPSCGRFVGTLSRCPYCQTETQKRLSIRVFKIISVLISTIGLLMLLFYARQVKTQEVKIKDLDALTNFAHVRIIARCNQGDGRLNKWGSLSFTAVQKDQDDERPHTIRVTAYNNVAKQIQDAGKCPIKGDLIEFEGQVRAAKSEISMLINAPEHIEILERPNRQPRDHERDHNRPNFNKDHRSDAQGFKANNPTLELEANAIAETHEDKPVKLIGAVVKEAQQVENDCVIIRIENGTEKGLPVFVPKFSEYKMELPKAGDKLDAFGTVKKYQGEMELKVDRRGYIKVTAAN